MKLDYYTFRAVNAALGADDNDMQQILTAGNMSFLCRLHFDTDPVSDTFGHWVCLLDLISDDIDIAERSLVLYPNTLHFEGDEIYTVSVTSDLTEIKHDDLQNVFITIGVPANE